MKGKRNPVAASLRSPHLRQQTVPSKKVYSRKGRKPKGSGPFSFLHTPLDFSDVFAINNHL